MRRALRIAGWIGEFTLIMLLGFELLVVLPLLLGGAS